MRNRVVRLVPIGVLILFAGVFWQMNGGAESICHAGLAYPAENFSSNQAYRVLKVVDGDTIKIDYKGTAENVRLIGVDTPETVHPSKPVEFFGKEASAFTKNLLRGESVYLRLGNEERGKYGRLLAYVFRAPDGLFVNLEIVRQGYGHAYTRFPFKHQDLFLHYEARARSIGKGLWSGASATAASKVESKAKSESVPDASVDGGATVYVTKSGTKYHRESCRWGNIKMTLAEAREKYSPCKKCSPPQ